MKHLNKYLVVLILLSILGCNEESGKFNEIDQMDALLESQVGRVNSNHYSDQNLERKLVTQGEVEFETDNLISTREIIFEAVENTKAYVSSDREYKSSYRETNTITIRVPAENFDNFLNYATKGVKKFDRKEIIVNDVTVEFLDIEARLKTKKELEKRYLELLKKAKNVTEILEIEKEAGKLRSEIESTEGRLNYLQNSISFSVLEMTFYESSPSQTEFGKKFKLGFKNGWDNLIWFFVILINIWPFIIAVLGVIFGIRVYRKKRTMS